MAERRSKQEIVYDILELIRKKTKVKPTHILYKGNLSYNRLKIYLDDLEQKQLIAKVEEKHKKTMRTFYKLTDKGFMFLEQIGKIREVEEAFGI